MSLPFMELQRVGHNWETEQQICKIDSWWEVAVQHREPSLMLCDDLEGWDGGGEEAQEIGDICVVMAY